MAGSLRSGKKPMTYLKFLMDHAGAPSPGRICVMRHGQEWANRQIVDEFRVTWPLAEVSLVEAGALPSCDLLVVPFDGDSSANAPRLDKSLPTDWVMIYGLENRRIWVFRKQMAISFLRSAGRFQAARRILAITKLARPLKEGLRIWKRFSNYRS